MVRKLTQILLVAVVCLAGIAVAAEKVELVAPGGGDMDLKQNLVKYYGTGNQPVVIHWNNSDMEAYYLEYFRDKSVLNARDRVKLTQTAPSLRIIHSGTIHIELNRDYCSASDAVVINYDPQTVLSCDNAEWDRKNDSFQCSGSPVITYQDWKMTGSRIEGRITSGDFIISGPIWASDGESELRSGQAIFHRDLDQIILRDKPVFTRGKNEMTATEIIYNTKTKIVTANGPVQSRLVDDKQGDQEKR